MSIEEHLACENFINSTYFDDAFFVYIDTSDLREAEHSFPGKIF